MNDFFNGGSKSPLILCVFFLISCSGPVRESAPSPAVTITKEEPAKVGKPVKVEEVQEAESKEAMSALKEDVLIPQDSASIEKGRVLYIANCIRCHNKDPNTKGSIGPEIVDAPYDVFYSKIMTGRYPDPLPTGFVPKRKSRAMQALPKLKNDIPFLYSYVQSVKKK